MFKYKEKDEFRSFFMKVQRYYCPESIDPEDFSPVIRLMTHSLASYFEETKERFSPQEAFDILDALI